MKSLFQFGERESSRIVFVLNVHSAKSVTFWTGKKNFTLHYNFRWKYSGNFRHEGTFTGLHTKWYGSFQYSDAIHWVNTRKMSLKDWSYLRLLCRLVSVLCFTRQSKLCEKHHRLKGSLTDDDHRLKHLAKIGWRISSIHGHSAELSQAWKRFGWRFHVFR